MFDTLGRYIRLPPQWLSNDSADGATTSGSGLETNSANDDFDWGLDPEESKDKERDRRVKKWIQPIRSALLVGLVEEGFPNEQRWIFYFLLIQFHEDLYAPLLVYSLLPSLFMWYFPDNAYISPMSVYHITRSIDGYMRSEYKNISEMLVPTAVYTVPLLLISTYVSFKGMTEEVLEPLFGPSSTWPWLLLPIFPGMFLRSVNERPHSINGFIPENNQGILLAIFIRACTAVLPQWIQWMIWIAYAAPSPDHLVMFADWLFCTFAWMIGGVMPLGALAIWLLVNQYRHPRTWFRLSGGGPSVILQRERRGTIWYIATIVVMQLVEIGVGQSIRESDSFTLTPQTWIPLVLIFFIGLYLLKYGVLLRIYQFKHKPLKNRKHIRLLRLRAQPTLPNSPIQCDMIHTTLYRPPQYIAVSHRWEPAGARQEIIMIDGGLFSVSRAIYSLLRSKRSNLQPQYFWIDSICINQADNLEKSSQVSMMRNIFEEAEMTLGWLGHGPGAKKAVGLVKRINETRSSQDFTKLCAESDAGWTELERLMSNEWFERVWIVQEIAIAKSQILRYGDEEIEWDELAEALARVMHYGLGKESKINTLFDRREVLSALIMEEVKAHISSVNLIKLKDTLKLTLRFRATLPIDKVYALLGLVDERHTPLFHPSFGLSDNPRDKKTPESHILLRDSIKTMNLLTEIFAAARGETNSRRARAILSSGTDRAIRYTKILVRDLQNLNKIIKLVQQGISDDLDEDFLRPDYSGNATAQSVYTYMARDLAKQGDALSFLRHAGIGLPRNQDLASLPSWVPDWSTDVRIYVLPWFKEIANSETNQDEETNDDEKPTSVIKDGGSTFLFVKGFVVGKIAHMALLSQDSPANLSGSKEEVEKDFVWHSSNFQSAVELARRHIQSEDQSDEAFEETFYSNLTAGMAISDHITALSMYKSDSAGHFSVSAALWPEKYQHHWNRSKHSSSAADVLQARNDFFEEYRFTRHTNSSANSKFAHFVRADIVPSIAQYCAKGSDVKKNWSSLLREDSGGPFAGFEQYVDYTIGRSFVITDSGLMGLSLSSSEVGDVIVQVEVNGRVVWLTLREEAHPEPPSVEITSNASSDQGKDLLEPTNAEPSTCGTFRFVGEAYVSYTDSVMIPGNEQQWFKLW